MNRESIKKGKITTAATEDFKSLVVEWYVGDDRYNRSRDEAVQPVRQTFEARENGQGRTEGGHTRLKVQSSFLYADNSMVDSTNPGWIQTAFYNLTELFYWVGLNNNVQKTVGMVCHPFQAVGVRAYEAYTRRTTGVGRDSKETQREWFRCPKCGKYLTRGSLDTD